MNFLAHFELAWPDEWLIAGALEGDYYKGPLRRELPPGLARGIALHRAIDGFTDNHPIVAQLRREFPPRLRRYAGILIDLSFDHWLTLHWHRYSDIELSSFNEQVYTTLSDHREHLSPQAQTMQQRLLEYDILGRYRQWLTVSATAARIGERFRHSNPLADVEAELAPLRALIEQAFLGFYPQLRAFSADYRAR